MADPLILAFDTSAAHCAAALLSGDRVLLHRQEPMLKGQAERLFPMLEEMLAEARTNWQSLAALGVGTGPGNFTGVRIAVAAARGLALSLDIPTFGVSAFETMLGEVPLARVALVCLMAPRDMVYVQAFRAGEPSGRPEVIDPIAPPRHLQVDSMMVVGHRAAEIGHQFEASWEDTAVGDIAVTIGRMVHLRLLRGEASARPSPLYVRPADASPSSESPLVILS